MLLIVAVVITVVVVWHGGVAKLHYGGPSMWHPLAIEGPQIYTLKNSRY